MMAEDSILRLGKSSGSPEAGAVYVGAGELPAVDPADASAHPPDLTSNDSESDPGYESAPRDADALRVELEAQRKRRAAAEELCAQLQAQAAREVAEAEARLADVEADLADTRTYEGAVEEESRRLAARCEALQEQLNQRTARCREVEERYEEAKREQSDIAGERDHLQAELLRERGETEGVRSESERLAAELLAVRSHLADLEERYRRTSSTTGSLKNQIAATQAAAEDARARGRTLREQLENSSTQLTEALNRVAVLERENKLFREERDAFRAERARLDRESTEGAEALGREREVRERAEAELRDRTRDLSQVRQRLDYRERERDAALQELAERISAAEIGESRTGQLQMRVAELEAALAAVQEVEAALRQRAEQQESEAKAAEQRAREAEENYQTFAEELTLLRVELNQQKREAETLRGALEKEKALGEHAGVSGMSDDDESEVLRREIADLQTLTDALSGEVENVRRAREADRATVERLKEQLERQQAQIGELDSAAGALREQESALRGTVGQLQDFLLQEQSKSSAIRVQLEQEAQAARDLRAACDEANAARDQMQADLERSRREGETRLREATACQKELQVEVERLAALVEKVGSEEKADLDSLGAQVQTLDERLAAAERDRHDLQERVAALNSTKDRLEQECAELRGRVPDETEVELRKTELVRLRSRLEEAEQQQEKTAERHAETVAGYMKELQQRSEQMREREAEMQKVRDQLGTLQQAADDAVSELSALRQERELLETRVREFEADGAGAAKKRTPVSKPSVAVPKPAVATVRPAGENRTVELATGEDPVTVVHAEADAGLREAARASTAKFVHACYIPLADVKTDAVPARSLLAINLLAKEEDPLAPLAHPEMWKLEHPQAFVYCADGGRGFLMGMVDFFFAPFDPEQCAIRLKAGSGALQRLLAVSEDVESMNSLREILSASRCSVSVAFDGRQALDLVPMVKPDVVLVDVSLPRADALRVVGRLRNDPSTEHLVISLLWGQPVKWPEFRQQALRIVRDFPFANEDLESGLTRFLSDIGSPPTK